MSLFKRFLVIGLCLTIIAPVWAQEATVSVPDVTGLNVPQAAAALNEVGLRLGEEIVEEWTPDFSAAQNKVRAQSIPAGAEVAPGTAIDITVPRAPTLWLIYDDNDLTLVNRTGRSLNFEQITFASSDGAASFAPTRWGRNRLPDGDCAQVWSVGRGEPKRITECDGSIYWLTTNNTTEHFWTQLNRVAEFSLLLDGVELLTCAAAPPGSQDNPLRCGFYWPDSIDYSILAPFVYFSYTTETFAVINTTGDQWMPIRRTEIHSAPTGMVLALGDTDLYPGQEIIGDVGLLAPGQCVVWTVDNPTGNPPELCRVIARQDVPPAEAFWRTDFVLQSVTDDQQRHCPGAAAGKLTLCVMPR